MTGEAGGGSVGARNRAAWSTLYESTEDLVWGERPVPFADPEAFDLVRLLRPRPRVLDVGAGEGRNVAALLELDGTVDAMDTSRRALSKIPARYRGRVRPVVADVRSLPYADGAFDYAFVSDVIVTLPEVEHGLREVHRALAPGGWMVCNIPGAEDPISEADMVPAGPDGFLFRRRFFYRFLEERPARALLEEAGFDVRDVRDFAWAEPAHPNFRDEGHTHESRVFLARRREPRAPRR